MWVRGHVRNHVVPALQENKKLSELASEAAVPASALQALRPAANAKADFRRSVARYLTIASLILIAVGVALLDHAINWPSVFVFAGALASITAAHLALAAPVTPSTAADIESAEIEGRLEQLKDAQWVLSENETRYRDLLDTQDVMISRRDARGRYVFVNKAFCSAFGVAPSQVLGQKFTPNILDGQVYAPLSAERDERRCYEELVQTQRGPRWIAWEEQLVHAASGYEIQSIGRDVSAEREAEAHLTEARDQAQSANRAKSRFLAAMSHEIRTPMNGILGMTGLLSDTPQTSEQRTYLAAIDKSARALLALIDEILDFSKIEAGKMELIHAPFDLRNCIMGAIELLAPRAREKGLDLTWTFASDLAQTFSGDELRVRQIVLNLLSNAVKFTDTGNVRVTVSALQSDGTEGSPNIAISVADTGIGLAAGDMQKLFDEFEQAEPALTRREGGTGLGLAISKRLARAMGGDIAAEGAPGRGATFTVVLRLDRPPAGISFAAPDTALSAPVEADPSAPDHATASTSAKKPRVLIAEDNEINALLARRVVEKAGCVPTVVGTGADAVSAVKEMLRATGQPIDLILMDVFMPGLDGMEAAREIRRLFGESTDTAKRPPIIALTANAFAEDRQRCLAAGMDDYLAKPFDAADLKTLLDRWVMRT
jgi:two-component system, sensor histidine kinase